MIPIFVADLGDDGTLAPFDFENAKKTLPDSPHARQANASRIVSDMRFVKWNLTFSFWW